MNHLDILLSSTIVSYFKTGNPILDTMILISITSTLPYLSKNKKIINFIKKCLPSRFKYTVKLLSFESLNANNHLTTKSSIAYNAVNFFIKQLKNCEINEISENGDSFLRFNTLYNNSDELETNDKVGFDITQTDGFHIEDSIYGMYEINENEDKDGKHSIKKNLCLKSNLSMIEINNFIEKCIKIFDDYQEKQTSKGPFIFNYKGKKNDFPIFDEKYFKSTQYLSNTIFDNKDKLENAIVKFKNNYYYERHPSITRKLIFLFHGEPGTGKTFAIRLLANELKRNIIVVPLNKINNLEELHSVLFFKKINEHKITSENCVFVIEDLDAMSDLLKNRNNKTEQKDENNVSDLISLLKEKNNKNEAVDINKKNTLTMSDVLNTLDGIYKLDNFVIAFSTNHIEQLDPAFLRDQRITHKIEFIKCSRHILCNIIEQWYCIKVSEYEFQKLKDNKYTIANIATLCDKYDNYEDLIQNV